MNLKVNTKIKSIKKFLSNDEVKQIIFEISCLLNKKINKSNFKTDINNFIFNNRKSFDDDYLRVKNRKIWKKIYKDLKNLKSIKKILIPKVIKVSKKIISKKVRIINKGIRIIEKNDLRSYPIHQEYKDIRSNFFLVFWIALHKISLSEGGLLIAKKFPNKPLIHKKNKMRYPILLNQKTWLKKCREKSFDSGEALILGKYVPHGTAKKTKGPPRWACIVRVGI